jgi:hypothetical protein
VNPLAVLYPRGPDPEQSFPDFAGDPKDADALHAPLGYHAFAAATGGAIYRKDQQIPADARSVLLMLGRDLKACRGAIAELRLAKKTVAVALKNAEACAVAELLGRADRLKLFQEICARADLAIATTPDLVSLFLAAGARHAEFILPPLPVEDERWDLSTPIEERRGIFIGTRSFAKPSGNHLAALLCIRQLAEAMHEPVTVFNGDGWRGRRLFDRVRFTEGLLRVVEGGKLSHPRYIRFMGQHRLVFQLDAGAGEGQVAGDALLCRIPCVGGNGAADRWLFPELCGHGRTTEQLFDLAARLLEHPYDTLAVVEKAMEVARDRLAFAPTAKRLTSLFERMGR